MQGTLLFEYAVIRVVPRVEREEFMNVGVILLCRDRRFLQSRIQLDLSRLKALCPSLEVSELQQHIRSFERICVGENDSGPIGELAISERFRWLTAARSTILQTSRVHPGLCVEPSETLERLFAQLVEVEPPVG